MFETASHFARYHLCQPLLKKFPQANPILLNPIFSNRVHRVWVQLKYLLEQEQNTQYNRKPMSGFFSVFYALNMCDKVSASRAPPGLTPSKLATPSLPSATPRDHRWTYTGSTRTRRRRRATGITTLTTCKVSPVYTHSTSRWRCTSCWPSAASYASSLDR
jgi:hypothetical protein